MNTNHLMKKKSFHLFCKVLRINEFKFVVFNFKIFFCSDFNLKAIIVKTDKIKRLKTVVYPLFYLDCKNFFFQNNY